MYFLTITQYKQHSTPSNWWLYQLKACVRSGVIHLTLKRTRGPAIQTHRRHQLPLSSPFTPFSMPHKRFAPRLPTCSPLSLSLSCFAHSPSFIHSFFYSHSHSFSSPLQLTTSHRLLLPHLLLRATVTSSTSTLSNITIRYLNDYQ